MNDAFLSFASSAAAVDIANDEGTLMLFMRDWLRGGILFVSFLLLQTEK